MSEGIQRLQQALAGSYEVEYEIGWGRMATVYLAQDLKHQRRVALKVLKSELAATVDTHRFRREIQIAARLQHPHILPLYDSGQSSDFLYYVMPYIRGGSMRDRIREDGKLPLESVLDVGRYVSKALEYAHSEGFIHRDIKPENILLVGNEAIVSDFGIARAISVAKGERGTQTGFAVGTPGYMSPEQASGDQNLDGRSDIFSLGCVLYEALAGERPFRGTNVLDVITATLGAEPDWNALPHETPDDLREIIVRSLKKESRERPAGVQEVLDVIEDVLRFDAVVTRPVGGLVNTTGNLPRELTTFVGRHTELRDITDLLGPCALVTLTGAGGCGKSRLALRIARDMESDYHDGVWFVDLAPVREPERVAGTIATSLGIGEEAGVPVEDTLAGYLEQKEALLLLDNCEHLLPACRTAAAALLRRCPGLRILATSRERLGLPGEQVFQVPPLPVPDSGAEIDLIQVAKCESVQLFNERARLVYPRFEITDADGAAVAAICRTLDGIPLAIEFAAARANVLSVTEINERLSDRFRFLTQPEPAAAARHQTLKAALDWGYEYLTDEERRLFRSLSIFSGGWTLAAATAICCPSLDDFATLDLLSHLVDKSLVVVGRGKDGSTRYRMLDTVRDHAKEKLAEAKDEIAARRGHLEYYLSFAKDAETHPLASGKSSWFDRFEDENENLRVAIESCDFVENGSAKRLQLVGQLWRSWFMMGNHRYLRGVLNRALEETRGDEPSVHQAMTMIGLGTLAYLKFDYEVARTHYEDALALYRLLGEEEALAWLRTVLGGLYALMGRHEAAAEVLAESLQAQRRVGNKDEIAKALQALAKAQADLGDLSAARENLEETLQLCRKKEDEAELAQLLTVLGGVCGRQGDDLSARGYYLESIDLYRKLGESFYIFDISRCFRLLGDSHRREGNLERASECLLEALQLSKTAEDLPGAVVCLESVAALSLARGDLRVWARLVGAAETARREMSSLVGVEGTDVPEGMRRQVGLALDEQELGEVWAAGRALSVDDAMSFAEEWLASSVRAVDHD